MQQIETFELDKVKDLETIERAQLMAQELDASKKELEVAHASLTKDLDHLEKANKLTKDELKKLGENHELLQATHEKALGSLKEPVVVENNAFASNSTSFEASILKENVELRAQLELLTSNYRELEESHEKLSGSHNDLLISYDGLKLAHEASITKVTSCEPHVDISTDRKSTRLNSSHITRSRMPSSA